MKTRLALAAALLTVAAAPAFAQGGSPYNRSGSQAGGPLAGAERAYGAPGGVPAIDSTGSVVIVPRDERGVLVREVPPGYPPGAPTIYGR
ncbi:hypothetical protein [Methylobacterium nonmethylotrophicum]|uniref:Uncharacterized protein n=1 Tax=Methylobacterium nonmethylotrophicum TaxID=1141884 RepID=A0A4Z0NS96_9HYPH|nr:hypothetical protein [Methylobacterium nonmethylotrophicum]TGD99398.1 hypothetical protein EU555_12880 [Methylobacterium nonmethylotrophicum]